MNRVITAIDTFTKWFSRILSFIILITTLVVTYGVIVRYVFNRPSPMVLDLSLYLCLAIYVLMGAYAQLSDGHVRVDLFYAHWRPKMKALVNLLASPIFFGGIIILGWAGAEWTATAIRTGTSSGTVWTIPIWPIRMLIPLGCLLLMLQGISSFLRDFNIVRSSGDKSVN